MNIRRLSSSRYFIATTAAAVVLCSLVLGTVFVRHAYKNDREPDVVSSQPAVPAIREPATDLVWSNVADPAALSWRADPRCGAQPGEAVRFSICPSPIAWTVGPIGVGVCDFRKSGGSITSMGGTAPETAIVSTEGLWIVANNRDQPQIAHAINRSTMQNSAIKLTPQEHLVGFTDAQRFLAFRKNNVSTTAVLRSLETKNVEVEFPIHIRDDAKPDRGAIAVSPGGRYLATFHNGVLHAYEIRSGRSTGQLKVPEWKETDRDAQISLAFNWQGTKIAIWRPGATESHLDCWDWESGALLHAWQLPRREELWKHQPIMATYTGPGLAWLRDESAWVIDGHLLIDVATGEPTDVFPPGKRHAPRLVLDRQSFIGFPIVDPGNVAPLSLVTVSPARIAPIKKPSLGATVDEDQGVESERTQPSLANEVQKSTAPLTVPVETMPEVDSVADSAIPQKAGDGLEVKNSSAHEVEDQAPSDFYRYAGTRTEWAAQRLQLVRSLDQPVLWIAKPDPAPKLPLIHHAKTATIELPLLARLTFPDGPSDLVLVGNRGKARHYIVNLVTGKTVGSMDQELYLAEDHLSLSADGRYLTGMMHGEFDVVNVWDVGSGKVVLKIPSDQLLDLHFSREGYIVAFIESRELITVEVTNLKTGELVRKLDAPRINDSWQLRSKDYCAVSAGGRYAAMLWDGLLQVFDLFEGKLAGRKKLPFQVARADPESLQMACHSLTFTPDGKRLAAFVQLLGGSNHFVTWDFSSGEVILARHTTLGYGAHPEEVRLIEWLPGGDVFCLNQEYLVDGLTGAAVWRLPDDGSFEVVKPLGLDRWLATRDIREKLVTVTGSSSPLAAAIKAARTAPSETVPPLTASNWDRASQIPAPAMPPVWGVELDPAPAPVDVKTEKMPFKKTGVIAQVYAAKLARRDAGKLIVQHQILDTDYPQTNRTGVQRPEQMRWLESIDLTTGKRNGEVQLPSHHELIDVTPDGLLALTGSALDARVGYFRLDVWSLSQKKHAIGWSPEPDDSLLRDSRIRWAAFVTNREVLAATTRGLSLWQLPDCAAKYVVEDFGKPLAVSPGGRYVVGIHDQRGLEFYHAPTGKCVGVVHLPSNSANSITVRIASFDPDATMLAVLVAQPSNEHVVLINLKTGQITSTIDLPALRSIDHLQWLGTAAIVGHGRGRNSDQFVIDLNKKVIVGQSKLAAGAIAVGSRDDRCWYAHDVLDPSRTEFLVRSLTLEQLASLKPDKDGAIAQLPNN